MYILSSAILYSNTLNLVYGSIFKLNLIKLTVKKSPNKGLRITAIFFNGIVNYFLIYVLNSNRETLRIWDIRYTSFPASLICAINSSKQLRING